MRLLSRPLALLAALLCVAALPAAADAQQADVIRGRVTGPDSLPIEHVAVTVTSISGGVTRTARTDRHGRFTVTFPGGDGDYMVGFSAMGYAAKRFELKRVADEEILIADTRLARAAVLLDPVRVNAARERVSRNDVPPDIGGTEQAASNAAVAAADMGELAAMAAALPGVQLVPGEDGAADGFSVLGLDADQNNTTLNGMAFGGSSLPRDAAISTSLVTSPYDVSRGGFSGAQFMLRTRSGSNFITRGTSLNLDAPPMQWTDRAARALGQEYTNLSLGGTLSGPIRFDRAFYSVAYQLGRRASDAQSLLDTDPLGLRTAGVAPDSAARLRDILRGEGVPSIVRGYGDERVTDQGTIFGSVDFAPPSSTSGQAFNLTFNGGWNRQRPALGGATSLPASGGDRASLRGGIQGRHSAYVGFGILTETSLGISLARTEGTPYLDLPAGRVRVSSDLGEGEGGVEMLSFGGSPMNRSEQSTRTSGVLNQLSWFSGDNKHRLKLTSELRHESSMQDQAVNTLGSFVFTSLADLEAGRPSTFTRQFGARRRETSQLVAGISLGDAFRPTRDVQLQYGVRLDGNRFLTEPAYNPELERLFGARNDRVPNRIYISPRAGFSWTYGTAAQIAGFQGAARGPRAVVRGGIGMFQNTPATSMIGSALDATGLPSAVQQVTCIGDAAPAPDWAAYASDPSLIPDRCLDGGTGTPFANSAPAATYFARDWSAPRSLRSNLQWSGPVLANRFATTVDATYSLNLRQSGVVDRNFVPVVRFTLPDEAARPVYVEPASIQEPTGAVAAGDARLSPLFSRVTEMRSDLRSESRQVSLRLSPVRFSTQLNWSIAYVYSNVRERVRGFGSTAGNPLEVEWARSPRDSRHQLTYNIGYEFFDAVRVTWFGSFRSGTPFTPTIAGDVNGDGYANDRAFIFDPALAGDTSLARAMRSLLDDGPSAAARCLRGQVGRLAARNSCQGPWTSTANLSIGFNPVKFRMPQRASLSLQLSNPLGAADLLLNGERGLRGWGQRATPDAALFYVRGFDRQAQRFRYEVNERFGATDPARSADRAPVTLTALLRFDVGPTRERQMLTQQLDRGRRTPGQRAPEPMLRAMYGSGGGIPNPLATILRQQDTLELTGPQADSIASLNRGYTIRIDSIWAPVVKYFDALPPDYDRGAAYDRYLAARQASVDLLIALAPTVKRLLTAEQRRKLPPFVASYLEPRYLASIRSGTATFTGGGRGAGDMIMVGGGGMVPAGAGGGSITVIRHQ